LVIGPIFVFDVCVCARARVLPSLLLPGVVHLISNIYSKISYKKSTALLLLLYAHKLYTLLKQKSTKKKLKKKTKHKGGGVFFIFKALAVHLYKPFF
jgi:hypothetical protein